MVREGGTEFPDRQAGEPLAHIDTGGEVLTLDEPSEETTGEGITSTVGVNNICGVDLPDRVGLDGVLGTFCDNGGLGSLGDNDVTGPGGVDLGKIGKLLCNLGNICDAPVVGLRVCESLGLVTDEVVKVWDNLIHGILEELAKERSGEIHGKDLVCGSSMLSKSQDGRNTNSQAVSFNVENICVLNESPDLLGLEMLKLVVVCGTKVSDHGSIVTGNDDSTFSGGDGLLDAVLGTDTALNATGLDELVGVGVLANTADVDGRFWWENILSSTASVLSSTSGNVAGAEGCDLLVDGQVLLLSEDSIIGLQSILVEQSLVTIDLDVEKGVSQAQELVFLGHLV